MNAYVINLDSRPDRMEKFKENKFPFEVQRFPGVVAETGEDGCTYSHLQLLEQQTEYPFAVFEDDCVLIQPWDVVRNAIRQLPANWDALWLGATLHKPLRKYSINTYRLERGHTTHAIIYNSKRIVDYILQNHNTQKGKNLDIFYCNHLQAKFNCFITSPMVATQRNGYSDISKQEQPFYDYIINQYNRFTK